MMNECHFYPLFFPLHLLFIGVLGLLNACAPQNCLDLDGDGHCLEADCNDRDPAIHHGADEFCDGIDNNCDGVIDDGSAIDATIWYGDWDQDGFGVADTIEQACKRPEGYAEIPGDCQDQDGLVHPNRPELCNGIDDDCDGHIDRDAEDLSAFYQDGDGDGFGDANQINWACNQPDGYVIQGTDCDDGDPSISPAQAEQCDGIDNNCDGAIEIADQDADGDGHAICVDGLQAVGDCNDLNPEIHPEALEVCDGLDNDCNGQVDELAAFDQDGDGTSDCVDDDLDGFDEAEDPPDCDDRLWFTYPGAPEVGDATDNDCDGRIDEGIDPDTDWDGDGFRWPEDCNDAEASIYPGAPERCDGVDNNCDALIDEDGAIDAALWSIDYDGDGFGDAFYTQNACIQPPGFVDNSDDCNDLNGQIYPGAPELCDELDGDCDGIVDETFTPTYFHDGDGDGFGSAALTLCAEAPNAVLTRGDCDDADPTIYPGADDLFGDGVDSDCGGSEDADQHVGLSPSSSLTLQLAINSAKNGTTIWVGPGVYEESGIQFSGRAITLASTHLAPATTINAQFSNAAFLFTEGETQGSVVDGFTLTGGDGTDVDAVYQGGAIYIRNSSPHLKNLYFINNDAEAGGAIFITGGTPTIEGCVFTQNQADIGGAIGFNDFANAKILSSHFMNNSGVLGGGIHISGSSPTFSNTLFESNFASGSGGAVYLEGQAAPLFEYAIFANNSASLSGGGFYIADPCEGPAIRASILSENGPDNLFAAGECAAITLDSNLFFTETLEAGHNLAALGDSNLVADPQFTEVVGASSFHLQPTSPALDAITNPAAPLDVDGSPGDMGLYGGPLGANHDRDFDGYPDYFWPGTVGDAPLGFNGARFDGDDQDAAAH